MVFQEPRKNKVLRPGDNFTTSNNTIHWYSRQSASCTTGSYMSPAMALAHEMGHAVAWNDDPEAYSWRSNNPNKKLPLYDNFEEMRNILMTELPVEIQLGEPLRLTHSSDIEYVNGPLDRFNPSGPKLQQAPN